VVVERAPAKVNLYLHVVGRRADGYHLLDSLVAFAELGDAVTAAPSDTLRLTVEGPFAAALKDEPDNLALRAARKLAASAGIARGAAITLAKNLPVASGIGGGSADAAATSRALCRLWNVAPGSVALDAIAQELGADVPVCLDGRASFIGGIGEQREEAPPLPPAGLLLVNPRIPLATRDVFAKRHGDFSQAARFKARPRDAADLAELLRARRNDLITAAAELVPAIPEVLDAIAATPGCLLNRMSGSGATCFGLYPTEDIARRAASWLSERRPAWWVAPTRLRPASGAE
jgi:4-diphosphocytidyl-2-C-methyl-D-erythritol kinase